MKKSVILPQGLCKLNLTRTESNNESDQTSSFRMSILKNLLYYLKMLFKGQRVKEPLLDLNSVEKSILGSILERKFLESFKLKSDLSYLKKKLIKVESIPSKKRPEENYKFVFKKCLKNMMKKYRAGLKTKLKKKDFELSFYKHYFSQISKESDIPIQNFFHPKNSKSYKNSDEQTPKTINADYIYNINKSRPFVEDFLCYLNKNLQKDYEFMIDLKFENLVVKWEGVFQVKDELSATRDICSYIKCNKKCKLPWSYREIEAAVDSVRKLF